jgi:hypothetical protein
LHASALQQSAQTHTGPVRIADCAQLPPCSFNLGDKEDATIAGAFENGDARFRRHVSQFLVAQGKRIPHRAIDPQLIRGDI